MEPVKKKETKTGIPTRLQKQYEVYSGYSFDDVRVHYHSQKPKQLNALAYTRGNEVYIAPGQEKHLGHELSHVVQQKKGKVVPNIILKGEAINTDMQLEQEADKMASEVAHTTDKKSFKKGQSQSAALCMLVQRVPAQDKERVKQDLKDFIQRNKIEQKYKEQVTALVNIINQNEDNEEVYIAEKNLLLYCVTKDRIEKKIEEKGERASIMIKMSAGEVYQRIEELKDVGEAGIANVDLAFKKLQEADNNYHEYYEILGEFHSNYFVNNKLEPTKTNEEALLNKFIINEDDISETTGVFLVQFCQYLIQITPPVPEIHFLPTENYHKEAMELLEFVNSCPFEQYNNFIDIFQIYYLYNTIEKWFNGKIATKEFIQAGKNIEKEKTVTKAFLHFKKILTLVPEVETLPDPDIADLIDMKDVNKRVGSFKQEEGVKNEYQKLFDLTKEKFLIKVEEEKDKWKLHPEKVINMLDTEFDKNIAKYKDDNKLTGTVFINAENTEEVLKNKHIKLKEKVKNVYLQKLNAAAQAPDFLDIKVGQIDKIANYYKDNIIASAKLDTQIQAGIAKQYSPSKQIWLKDILSFADGDRYLKNTAGDNCADLSCTANKETHSTLYRDKVADQVNMKNRTNADINNMVLGNEEHMCFHVSTNQFISTIDGKAKAAHAYRVGTPKLHFNEIGSNFAPLTKENLKNELTVIKNNEVTAKENLILNAINNHFHGYQDISNTVLIK